MANSPNPQLVELLREQLRDIHAPEPISWWPLAPGWWLLMLLGMVACVAIAHFLRKRWRERKYRRYLKSQLELYFRQWQVTQHTSTYCQNANQLLKRGMLRAAKLTLIEPTESVAALTGHAWVTALEAIHKPLSRATRNTLSLYIYQSEAQISDLVDVPSLHAELTEWCLNHRLEVSSDYLIAHKQQLNTPENVANLPPGEPS